MHLLWGWLSTTKCSGHTQSSPQRVKVDGSPDTIRGTSLGGALSLNMDHLNTRVCDVISGLFNLMDTRGAVVPRASKWVWNPLLITIAGPVGWFEGRATIFAPILNRTSLYRALPPRGTMSALKVISGLPVSTKRCRSSMATVIDCPAPITLTF